MDHHDLTGYYTYRSFLNRPEPAGDFNQIRFAEGEWFLYVVPDGSIRGTLAFPADPLAAAKEFMDLTGRVTGWSPPTIEIEGIGRPGTATELFDYKYQGSLAPVYPDAVAQRPAVVGTVLRVKQHGSAMPGFTASFVAVQRDFLPPRDIQGVALLPEAVNMLAARNHRLRHAVWHTVRQLWHNLQPDADAVAELERRGWWPEHPPFLRTGALDLLGGAGEDFLFMHRRMTMMFREVHTGAGKTPPAGWTSLPAADVPQTVYKPSTNPDEGPFVLDPDASGFMVPPPARGDDSDRLVKSPAFLGGMMRPLERLFESDRFLSAMSLGALGSLIEWTIHGWMHNRWMHVVYDSAGNPIGRQDLFDIDPKWDGPSNDDLGDFYSSHVHPTFWRLHGWIDDRVNQWAQVNASRLSTACVQDVPWFKADGHLVLSSKPFSWPGSGHHHPNGDDDDVRVLEEVMAIMRDALSQPAAAAARILSQPARLAFRDALLGINLPDLLEQPRAGADEVITGVPRRHER